MSAGMKDILQWVLPWWATHHTVAQQTLSISSAIRPTSASKAVRPTSASKAVRPTSADAGLTE